MWHIKCEHTQERERVCERRKPKIYPKKTKTYKFHSVKDNDRRRRRKTSNIQRRKQRSSQRIEIFRYTIEKVPEKSHSRGRESHFLNFHCQSLCRFSSFARSSPFLSMTMVFYLEVFVRKIFISCMRLCVNTCLLLGLSLCVCSLNLLQSLPRRLAVTFRFDSACKCERTRTASFVPKPFFMLIRACFNDYESRVIEEMSFT